MSLSLPLKICQHTHRGTPQAMLANYQFAKSRGKIEREVPLYNVVPVVYLGLQFFFLLTAASDKSHNQKKTRA